MAENPFQSPEVVEERVAPGPADYELARRGTRLAAVIVDGIMLNLLILPFAYYFRFGYFQPPLPPDVEVNPLNPISLYVAMGIDKAVLSIVIGVAAYFALNGYLLKSNGQTIGKRLFGIKIVRKNGAQAEFYRLALHRYLLLRSSDKTRPRFGTGIAPCRVKINLTQQGGIDGEFTDAGRVL